jgi:hypothetical protein
MKKLSNIFALDLCLTLLLSIITAILTFTSADEVVITSGFILLAYFFVINIIYTIKFKSWFRVPLYAGFLFLSFVVFNFVFVACKEGCTQNGVMATGLLILTLALYPITHLVLSFLNLKKLTKF